MLQDRVGSGSVTESQSGAHRLVDANQPYGGRGPIGVVAVDHLMTLHDPILLVLVDQTAALVLVPGSPQSSIH